MSRFEEDEEGYAYEDEEVDPDDIEHEWPHAKGPKTLNRLRACIPCMLVKSFEQFRNDGCENCNAEDDNFDEFVTECTTESFEGLVAMTQPLKSWVARWQFLNNFVPGVYALKVNGEVSEEAMKKLNPNLQNVGQILQQEDRKLAEVIDRSKASNKR